MASSTVIVHIQGPIATITLNRPEKLNALASEDYDVLAEALHDIDKREDVLVTILQANGRFFCAGTNVDGSSENEPHHPTKSLRRIHVAKITGVTDVARALYTHTKILVAILNGPALGIGAAYLGLFDFIYSTPGAWIALPFHGLGLHAEVNSSVTFPRRMGFSKANEVLLWGKKAYAEELLPTGFINKIFQPSPGTTSSPDAIAQDLHAQVRAYVVDRLSDHDPAALLGTKALIQAGLHDQNNPDAVSLRESTAQINRQLSGVPGKRFGEIARKERRHKL